MDIYALLIISHVFGAVLGVGGATFAEIFILKALRDGVIDPMEGEWLRSVYWVLRTGLAISIFSGFGFLLLYRLTGEEEKLLDPKLWAKMTIIIILLLNAIFLTARKIPLWLGSSLSFTSWYAAFILGAWRDMPHYSYTSIMSFYFIAFIAVAVVLHAIRKRVIKQT